MSFYSLIIVLPWLNISCPCGGQVKNLITLAGIHAGIASIPFCGVSAVA